MYVPEHFAMTPEQVVAMLATTMTGDLITIGPQGLTATYLPFSYDPKPGEFGSLYAHVARNNRQWRHQGPALVILHGPDHYISCEWGGSADDFPTWNYVTAHISGEMIAHEEPEWILSCLHNQVDACPDNWDMGRAEQRVKRFLPAIVGIEVRITSMVGKAKMSQNNSPDKIQAIIEALSTSDQGKACAEFMTQVSLPHAIAREEMVEEIRQRPS